MAIVLDGNNTLTSGVLNSLYNTVGTGTTALVTGIPVGVKRITISLNSVSMNSPGWFSMQLGAGSIQTTGYTGYLSCLYSTGSVANASFPSSAFYASNPSGTNAQQGVITLINAGSYTWIMSASISMPGASRTNTAAGQVTLSGNLDRFQFLDTSSGVAFLSGSITTLYE
jgi:hypothetical protein